MMSTLKKKTYKKLIDIYHGTDKESAMNIISEGGKEIFFTTSKDRALSYGNTLLKLPRHIIFDNRSDLYRFNKLIKNDFYDFKIDLVKNLFGIYLIEENKEEILYFMYMPFIYEEEKV